MRKPTGHVVVALVAMLSLGFVPTASAVSTSGTTYKQHLTYVSYLANDPCPTGTYKVFTATGRVTSSAIKIIAPMHPHYLRLTNGTTLKSVEMSADGDRVATWFFRASRTAKVSPYLSGSYTHVTVSGTITGWSDKLTRQCVG